MIPYKKTVRGKSKSKRIILQRKFNQKKTKQKRKDFSSKKRKIKKYW